MRSQLRDVGKRLGKNVAKLKLLVARDKDSLLQWANVEVKPPARESHEFKARSVSRTGRRISDIEDESDDKKKRGVSETWGEFRKVEYTPRPYIDKFASTNPRKISKIMKKRDSFENLDLDREPVRGLGDTKLNHMVSESFRGSMRKHVVLNQYKLDGRAVKFFMHTDRDMVFKEERNEIDTTTTSLGQANKKPISFLGSIDPQYRNAELEANKNKLSELKLGMIVGKPMNSTKISLYSKPTAYNHSLRTATTTYTDFRKLRQTYLHAKKGQGQVEESKLNKTSPACFKESEKETTEMKLKRVSKAFDIRERETAHKQKKDLYSFFDQDFVYDIDRILYPDKYGELFKPGIYIKKTILKEMEHKYRFEPWSMNWGLRDVHRDNKYFKLRSPSKDKLNHREKKVKATTTKRRPNRQILTEKLIRNRRVIKLVIENLKMKAYMDRRLVSTDDHEVFPVCPYYLLGSKQLFMHVKSDRIAKFQEFLDKNKNFIHQYDDQGRSLLHIVIIEKAIRCFVLLMTLKPYLSKKDSLGLAPLDYALIENNTYFVRELLGAGAYPFVKVFSQRNLKERVFSSNAYLVEQAMFLWIKCYYVAKGLIERYAVYCVGIKELLEEIKINK